MTGIIFKGLTSLGALAGTASAPVAAATQWEEIVDFEPIRVYDYTDINKVNTDYIKEALKAQYGNTNIPLEFRYQFEKEKIGEHLLKVLPKTSQEELRFGINQEFFKAHHQWKQAQSILKKAGYYASINKLNIYQLTALVRWTQQNRVDYVNFGDVIFHLNERHHTEYIVPQKRAWATYVENKVGNKYDFSKLTKWLGKNTNINNTRVSNHDLLIYALKNSAFKLTFKYNGTKYLETFLAYTTNVIKGTGIKIEPPKNIDAKYIQVYYAGFAWDINPDPANLSGNIPLNQFNLQYNDKVKYDFKAQKYYFR